MDTFRLTLTLPWADLRSQDGWFDCRWMARVVFEMILFYNCWCWWPFFSKQEYLELADEKNLLLQNRTSAYLGKGKSGTNYINQNLDCPIISLPRMPMSCTVIGPTLGNSSSTPNRTRKVQTQKLVQSAFYVLDRKRVGCHGDSKLGFEYLCWLSIALSKLPNLFPNVLNSKKWWNAADREATNSFPADHQPWCFAKLKTLKTGLKEPPDLARTK